MGDSDRLELCGLEVSCVIGDLPEERVCEQCLTVDIALACDLRPAGASDALADTVDYAKLASRVREVLKASRFHMIEAAAACVAEICLSDPRVEQVRVRVGKAAVAGLREAAAVIVRNRGTPGAHVPDAGLGLTGEGCVPGDVA